MEELLHGYARIAIYPAYLVKVFSAQTELMKTLPYKVCTVRLEGNDDGNGAYDDILSYPQNTASSTTT